MILLISRLMAPDVIIVPIPRPFARLLSLRSRPLVVSLIRRPPFR